MTGHTVADHAWLRRVSDYHSGGVSDAERAAVEAHLATCAECQLALADYRRFYALARSPLRLGPPSPAIMREQPMRQTTERFAAPPGGRPPDPRAPRRRLYVTAAAGLAAALVVAGFLAVFAGRLGPLGGHPSATATYGATATATPPPCNTHATTTAIVWDEGQQVQGGIGGAAPSQLSSFRYPLGLPDEGFSGNQTVPGFLAVSPDGAHIAVDEIVFVPFTEEIYPYVVDTATHAVSRVILPAYPRTPDEEPRLLAWADNHTLVVFQGNTNRGGGSTITYMYDITTHTATALPGVTNGVEGVVRCSTLYWMDTGAFTALSPADPNHTATAPERLHRYDLTSHSEIGSPIPIGVAVTTGGSEGRVDFAGWDVSRDNTTLVYQRLSVTSAGGTTHASSQFFAAHADGTGVVPILTGPPLVTSTTGTNLAISPDGTAVAVTNAQGTPTVATGPITGTGGTLVYTPDAVGLPAWLPDGSGFLSTRVDGTPASDIYQYLLATPPVGGRIPGTEVHPQGTDPATLP